MTVCWILFPHLTVDSCLSAWPCSVAFVPDLLAWLWLSSLSLLTLGYWVMARNEAMAPLSGIWRRKPFLPQPISALVAERTLLFDAFPFTKQWKCRERDGKVEKRKSKNRKGVGQAVLKFRLLWMSRILFLFLPEWGNIPQMCTEGFE